MTQKANESRYRTNPVELVIFFGITTLFSFSLYNLLYDKDQLQIADVRIEKPTLASSESATDRAPASAPSLFPITLDCGKAADQKTQARSARLTLPLCRLEGGKMVKGGDVKLVLSASVVNTVNNDSPTVFIDANPLTTGPIALNSGKNSIHVEYSYRDGQKITYDFVITRE